MLPFQMPGSVAGATGAAIITGGINASAEASIRACPIIPVRMCDGVPSRDVAKSYAVRDRQGSLGSMPWDLLDGRLLWPLLRHQNQGKNLPDCPRSDKTSAMPTWGW